MVFIVCALLAAGLACAGTVPDCLAVVAAISIGGHHRNRRAPTAPRYFPFSCAFTWNRKDSELLI